MKILLTGSTGGIGSAIKNRLKAHDLTNVPHADIETKEEFDWMICAHGVLDENNVYGTFYANVIANINLAQKIKAKNIIFISSTAGINGNDKYPIYAASKAALNMYCKSISSKQICYAICPGPTNTPMWRKLGLKGDVQSPKEVARAVEFVMAGNYQSGDIIIIRNGIIQIIHDC
jgi:NAD(P)-dependent dehydrogenase (short-subunit alcohol dehydrogenase family)